MNLIVYRNTASKQVYHIFDCNTHSKYIGQLDVNELPTSGWIPNSKTTEYTILTKTHNPTMKYPTPDLYDRYTIECLKRDRAGANNASHIIALSNEIDARKRDEDFIHRLYDTNGKIWDLESDIRKGKENELGLEEVGRRALAIRDINRLRILIKDEIAQAFGEYGEKKYNHASE